MSLCVCDVAGHVLFVLCVLMSSSNSRANAAKLKPGHTHTHEYDPNHRLRFLKITHDLGQEPLITQHTHFF